MPYRTLATPFAADGSRAVAAADRRHARRVAVALALFAASLSGAVVAASRAPARVASRRTERLRVGRWTWLVHASPRVALAEMCQWTAQPPACCEYHDGAPMRPLVREPVCAPLEP